MKAIVPILVLLSACAAQQPPAAPCMSVGDCELMNTATTHCFVRGDYAGRNACLCDPVTK